MLRVQIPTGCKPVTSDLEDHELEKRLKVLANKLTDWRTSDPKNYKIYETLAHHLANERLFLTNSNKTIQLYTAICHSNIFRAFCPMTPFPNTPGTLVTILHFLIDHLKPLNDSSSPLYQRSELILTNLTRSNAFALCSHVSDTASAHKILQRLVAVLFDIIEKNSEQNIHRLISFLLIKLLNSPKEIRGGILPFIFLNLTFSSNKTVQNFSKKILVNSKKVLQPILAEDLLTLLVNFASDDVLENAHSILSAIYPIYPDIQSHVLHQLVDLLKSSDIRIKSNAIVILFGLLEKEPSDQYWKLYMMNFLDKNEKIRIMCLEKARIFLLDYSTREAITQVLTLMQRDHSAQVRSEVITTIVSAAEEEPDLFMDTDLLSIIKERSLDKEYLVRKHTLKQLASVIYSDRYSDVRKSQIPDIPKSAVSLIMNEVMCGYYVEDERDRMYVEKILNTWFICCHADVQDRMMTLYYVFDQLNDNACRAFTQLHIHRSTIRKCLTDLVETRRELRGETDELRVQELEILSQKQLTLFSKFLPGSVDNPDETKVNLQKFFEATDEDSTLAEDVEGVLQPDVTCTQSEDFTNNILSKIGNLDTTNPYYNTIRASLERSCSMVIDATAIRVLIEYLIAVLERNDEIIDSIGLNPNTAATKGFNLLEILSFSSAAYFIHPEIYGTLVSFLEMDDPSIVVNVLHILTNVGKVTNLDDFAATSSVLQYCKSFIISGSRGAAKAAVKLVCDRLILKHDILEDFLERIKVCLMDPSQEMRTAIASLGYIAWFGEGADEMVYELMKMIYRNILRFDPDEVGPVEGPVRKPWTAKETLPRRTIDRLEAMKCITRWVIARPVQESYVVEIIRLLVAFISKGGDVDRVGSLRPAEKSWLRLQAGACLLKMCRSGKIGDRLEPKQFYHLSKLMLDDVFEVRECFQSKLMRGLNRYCPRDCLPIDFMGFFALGGLEKDDNLREGLRRGMIMLVRKRNRNLGKLMRLGEAEREVVENLKPECVVVYALVILAHWNGKDTNCEEKELGDLKKGMEFIMQYWLEGGGEEKEATFRLKSIQIHIIN
ncbi:sister chromatid cohesion protein PDS5 homolog B-like isoform X2 [Diachasmimorpha longicaudata]|uniref:sister chromatid cohesion protein PDS5 homolog B-like isoform X2 n=1 Tax=Diachasmimorpha longicaudata TaxID=58733 RepID=UPI0030B8C050